MTEEELLSTTLPGSEIKKDLVKWGGKTEKPWKLWKTGKTKWAIFLIDGDILSKSKIDSIEKSKEIKIKPIVLISNSFQVPVITNYYLQLHPYIICDVAGKGKLIPPPPKRILDECKKTKQKHRSRIPKALLKEILNEKMLPKKLKSKAGKLAKNYENLKRIIDKDSYEQKILEDFGNSILSSLGFTSERLKAAKITRKLELSKIIKSRDHFFHSFHNYFLGLLAICKLFRYFEVWKDNSKLKWEIDSFDIWFLTAIWHDVGYNIQSSSEIITKIFGAPEFAEYADTPKYEYLKLPETKNAIREISSLILRLLQPDHYRTTWVRPTEKTKINKYQRKIIEAIEQDFIERHGAASAIILYNELMQKVDKMMDYSKREVLSQAILIACCSIPFHDWYFRKCLREKFGCCSFSSAVLPFASTLTFIDSIQEDRRNITKFRAEIRFLEKLIIRQPRYVRAKVNLKALNDNDILWKIIESHDVNATLLQGDDSISFEYPDWMVS